MLYRGFWILRDGEIVDLGYKKHIDLVIESPEEYGEDLDGIRKLYSEYNEPLSLEGYAREIILRRVIERGFVRIRQQKNQWMIQLWELTPEKEDHLQKWSLSVKDMYADVMIDQISKNERLIKTSIEALSSHTTS